MDESAKKPIMIAVVLACIVLAVFIFYKTKSKDTGIGGLKSGVVILLKCTDEACGNEFEVDQVTYYKYLEGNAKGSTVAPMYPCPKCGKETANPAIKCPSCDKVFFKGAVPKDYLDRCPYCGYSKKDPEKNKPGEAPQNK